MKQHEIPAGWKLDGEGRLVKIENISEQVLEEDALVLQFIEQAKAVHHAMQQLKTALTHTSEAFIAKLVADYGVKRLEKIKGNIDFFSFDRSIRISRRVQDTIKVNARIEAARQLFDQYINVVGQKLGDSEEAEGARVLISRAFKPAKKNEFSVTKLIDLLNVTISHPLFRQAVAALRDALETDGSAVYYNFYQRNPQGAYELLSLRFSDVPVLPANPAIATPIAEAS